MGLPDDENTQCLKAQVRSHRHNLPTQHQEKNILLIFLNFQRSRQRSFTPLPTLTASRKHNVAATSTSSKMKPSKGSETIKVVFRVRPLNSKEKLDGRQM